MRGKEEGGGKWLVDAGDKISTDIDLVVKFSLFIYERLRRTEQASRPGDIMYAR